jgi:hypothetical protein
MAMQPATRSLPERAGEAVRYFFEVIGSAIRRSGRFANRQGLVVATALSLAAGGIQAAVESNVIVWHVVRAGLIALGGLMVLVFVWNLLLTPFLRERRKDEEAAAAAATARTELETVQQELTNTRYALERAQEAEQMFGQAILPMEVRDRLVRLSDLPAGFWLHDRHFENVHFAGPATILVMGCNIERTGFYGLTREFLVVVGEQEANEAMRSAIVFHRSDLIRCEFHNVRILANQQTIDLLSQSEGL